MDGLEDSDARELRRLEERLFDFAVRKSASELERLLADDFVEIGGSGDVYAKTEIIAALAEEAPLGSRSLDDFAARRLAPDVALVTYRSLREVGATRRISRRSSIWRRESGGWRMVFHQGTVVSADGH